MNPMIRGLKNHIKNERYNIRMAQTQVGQKNEQNVKAITVKKVKKRFKREKMER